MDFDVAIIGAGPGGYSAALKASRSGLSACLIEKDKPGGTCLNRGCIPVKTLLASSEFYALRMNAAKHGIHMDNVSFDISRMISNKDETVNKLLKGMHNAISLNKVALIKGTAALKNKHTISVSSDGGGSQDILAKNIIISTGSIPSIPEFIPFDGNSVCSSNEILDMTDMPESIAIIGGGTVGCEFAMFFNNLGARVTVIELLPSILSNLDSEVSRYASRMFRKAGINIITGSAVKEIIKDTGCIKVITSGGDAVEVSRVLISAGRKPCADGIGLENAGIIRDAKTGKISVNNRMETNISGIYAVGDVCSSPFDLAHTASEEGAAAVDNILGTPAEMDYGAIPSCVYTFPEISCIGITEDAARESNIDIVTGKAFFAANGKALAISRPDGFVKLIVKAGDMQLIGAHVIGPHATDIIGELGILIRNRAGIDYILSTVHAHPTLYETIREAAENIIT